MTLKFDGWPRKIIGHLFYTTWSFVHHFKSIGVFKLELQSGNAQFRSKSDIFFSRVTLKFDGWPWKTRRSENDNTPQPLDQWTNSPFIGQQVGNCKRLFTLTHHLADLFAMHRGLRSIPLCIQHHIQLTSLSFQVSRPSHSWVTAISIFYLENPRSRSWVRSKFEVTNVSLTLYRLTSLSIHVNQPSHSWDTAFSKFDLKIQGQGHGSGQSWKSWSECNIISTHIPFVPCQSALPFLRYSISKIWPWKSKVKVMGKVDIESHIMDPIFYWLTSLSFHSISHPIPEIRLFQNWPWKSKVKVMVEVKVESHKVGVTSYRLTSLSFHVQ